jgi:hypothetical protein
MLSGKDFSNHDTSSCIDFEESIFEAQENVAHKCLTGLKIIMGK